MLIFLKLSLKLHHFAKRLSEHGWEGTVTDGATQSSLNQSTILKKKKSLKKIIQILFRYIISAADCSYQMMR